MDEKLSKIVVDMKPSGIRKFFDIVNEMDDAISLGVGEPDFDTPWHVREEGIYSLIITQIQIVKYEKTHVFICFPNFPFVALEEYGVNLFTDFEEAEKKLKQIRREEKIKKYQEIVKKAMEKNEKKT